MKRWFLNPMWPHELASTWFQKGSLSRGWHRFSLLEREAKCSSRMAAYKEAPFGGFHSHSKCPAIIPFTESLRSSCVDNSPLAHDRIQRKDHLGNFCLSPTRSKLHKDRGLFTDGIILLPRTIHSRVLNKPLLNKLWMSEWIYLYCKLSTR